MIKHQYHSLKKNLPHAGQKISSRRVGRLFLPRLTAHYLVINLYNTEGHVYIGFEKVKVKFPDCHDSKRSEIFPPHLTLHLLRERQAAAEPTSPTSQT